MDRITYEDKIELQDNPAVALINKVTAENMNSIKNVINNLIDEGIASIIKEENKKRYHVGSLIFDTKNINPSTYLGFGTWQLWGSGCVPVGVDTTQTEFNIVEKTGGGLTHSHASAAHTHTVASHTHTTKDLKLTVAQMPSHTHIQDAHGHGVGGNNGLLMVDESHGNFVTIGGSGSWWMYNRGTVSIINTIATNQNTGGGTAHNHGATNGTSLTTNSTTPGNTGSASTLQPYITCYIWKRTA